MPHGEATLCAMGHILPTVLVIGAQKAGTTSLHSDLVEHVVGATTARALSHEPRYYGKEMHHFDMHFRKGLAHYVGHFQRCPAHPRPRQFAIDATPSYLKSKSAPGRARALFEQERHALQAVRLIAVLRSPTERARSWFDHMGRGMYGAKQDVDTWALDALRRMRSCAREHHIPMSSGRLWRSACGTFRGPAHDALSGGMYAPQLEAWIGAFAPSQLAIVTFDGYLRRTERVLQDLAVFIGSRIEVPRAVPATEARRDARPEHAHRAEFAGSNSSNSSGASRPRRDGGGGQGLAIEATHKNVHAPSVLGHTARAALDDFYRPHVRAVLELVQRPANRHIHSTPFRPASALTEAMLLAK